jgi:hypothetical protein
VTASGTPRSCIRRLHQRRHRPCRSHNEPMITPASWTNLPSVGRQISTVPTATPTKPTTARTAPTVPGRSMPVARSALKARPAANPAGHGSRGQERAGPIARLAKRRLLVDRLETGAIGELVTSGIAGCSHLAIVRSGYDSPPPGSGGQLGSR